LLFGITHAAEREDCTKDLKVAIAQLEDQCKVLLRSKKIKLSRVRAQLKKDAKKVQSRQDHYEVLVRLVARLRDGHAYVRPAKGVSVKWPGPDMKEGLGLFLCRSGKKILVKNAWSNAEKEGIKAGDEVVKIAGKPAEKWLAERIVELSDVFSFSTDQHAFFYACHRGLGGPAGSKLKLSVKSAGKAPRTVTVRRGNASTIPYGPVYAPKGLKSVGRQQYGKTAKGWGYIHLRNTPRDLPEQIDQMFAALGNVPGLILDFRANAGGNADGDAVLARFVPAGKKLGRAKAYPIPSAGAHPYGGPVVVIVDAGAASSGETGSGMFKEDGRGYMIGESPTAGMSSSKVTIELPSKKFSLYMSVRSNKSRFQGGRGIEGIGIVPHEIIPYDAADLAAGIDTLIKRAEALLEKFPRNKVPYRPKQYGWKPPK